MLQKPILEVRKDVMVQNCVIFELKIPMNILESLSSDHFNEVFNRLTLGTVKISEKLYHLYSLMKKIEEKYG